MNFSTLSNPNFTERFRLVVQEERRITAEVLSYFREAEKRMLYAEMGYPSLLAFAVQELRYSEAAAYRRISAMRMMREIPEVKEKIQSGELTLSNVTRAATYVRQTEKQSKVKIDAESKKEILESVQGKSSREVERTLLKLNPDLQTSPSEKQRVQGDGGIQVTTSLDADLMRTLEEIQILLGRKMQIKDLLKYLADEQLKILKKKSQRRPGESHAHAKSRIKTKAETEAETEVEAIVKTESKADADTPGALSTDNSHRNAKPTAKVKPNHKRKYISIKLRQSILHKAQYRCCYIDPHTKRRCQGRHYLQLEHITPKSQGGSDDRSNLEILCSAHNKLRALQKLGAAQMKDFMPSVR